MEVQDTTNFLQRLLNFRFETPAENTDGAFAGMLQTENSERTSSLADEPEVALRKEIRVDDDIKDRDVVNPKQTADKKEPVEEKEPSRRDDKKTKKSPAADSPSENGAVKADEVKSQPAEPQETQAVAGADKQPAATDNTAEMPAGQIPAADSTNGATMVTAAALLTPLATGMETVSPEVDTLLQAAAGGNQASLSPQTTAQAKLTAEEAILLEQAQYLDKKVATDGKLKIDVRVEEAKIAAPVAKDVLQNRFEIDSLFQSVDAEVALADAETTVLVDADAPVAAGVKNDTAPQHNPAMLKAVAVFENQIISPHAAKETTAHAGADNAQILAVSGKEAVFEVANTARAETFARLNETASRDAFKGMGKEVVEQIKVNITKSAVKGVDTIDIQLKPEDLGKIQIKMHIAKDGRLHADIIASRPETIDMLQKDISGLEKAFNDAGYNADSRSFNFSFQKENQAGEQQKADSGRLQFIGDALEQDAEGVAGNDNLVWDPVLGLNIRV